MNPFDRILARRVLPAAVVSKASQAEPLARAFLAAGMDVMEVTFRSAESPQAVAEIRASAPEMIVGAGTLLTPEQVGVAVAVGAQFGVTPGYHPAVVEAARDAGLPLIPGVMTPGEVEQALEAGCRLVKFFPAAAAGGVAYLKALQGPYAHTGLRFIPLGGISAATMADYLALPIVGAVGGSWLTDAALMAKGDWAAVEALARDALARAAAVER